MKMIADKMGIDVFKIIEAANTKPYGFRRFWPGPWDWWALHTY